MSQQSFTKSIHNLFFGIDIKNSSADTVIEGFYNVSQLEPPKKPITSFSLSIFAALETHDEKAQKSTFIFKILSSPIKDLKPDSGYIKIGVGEAGNIRKIIDFEYCLQFGDKHSAELAFVKLVELFSPVSTLQKMEEDEEIRYAQFSTRREADEGIKDITIGINNVAGSSMYEIRLLPFNEFSRK